MYQDSTTKRSSILKSLEPLRIGIVYLTESRATMVVEGMGNLTFSPLSLLQPYLLHLQTNRKPTLILVGSDFSASLYNKNVLF